MRHAPPLVGEGVATHPWQPRVGAVQAFPIFMGQPLLSRVCDGRPMSASFYVQLDVPKVGTDGLADL